MLLNIHQPETRKRSRGFTLVELLMVISMIAIMAGMALVALRGAREDARESATEARISRIVAMLKIQFEEYEFRKLPLRLDLFVTQNPKAGVPFQVQIRNLKRRIILDMINSEMPRAIEDPVGMTPPFFNTSEIGTFPTANPLNPTDPVTSFRQWLDDNYPRDESGLTPGPGSPTTLRGRLEALRQTKVTIWQRLRTRLYVAPHPYAGTPKIDLPAEYLYEILANSSSDDTPALEGLSPNAIGDSDNDGALEIVDSWGDPLNFEIGQLAPAQGVYPFFTDPTSAENGYSSSTMGSDIYINTGSGRLNPIIPSPMTDIFLTLSSRNIQ